MPHILSAPRLRDALSQLNGWTGDPRGITRTMHLSDSVHRDLLERMKVCADGLHHYPLIERTGDLTRVWLVTDAVGGVTEADVALAARIDAILRRTLRPV